MLINRYLHSHLVKFRSPLTPSSEPLETPTTPHFIDTLETTPLLHLTKTQIDQLSTALQYSNIDSVIALTLALFVNSSILVVSAALFYGSTVADLEDAYAIIATRLGALPALCFGVALLLSGQSSTVTGLNMLIQEQWPVKSS